MEMERLISVKHVIVAHETAHELERLSTVLARMEHIIGATSGEALYTLLDEILPDVLVISERICWQNGQPAFSYFMTHRQRFLIREGALMLVLLSSIKPDRMPEAPNLVYLAAQSKAETISCVIHELHLS